MATAPVKPPLHNFPLSFLKWRTNKNNPAANNRYRRHVSAEPDSESDRTQSNRLGPSRAARHRLSLIPCSESTKRSKSEERESEEEEESEEADKAEEEVVANQKKPWNLRPRRAPATTSFFKASGTSGAANGESHEPDGTNRGQSEVQQQPKSMRLRGMAEGGGGGGGGQSGVEKKEKRKFWIALSKEDIEEDVFVMTGSRPSRRPKKRPKIVQKQLDSIFPGLWLADAYKAADSPSKR